MHYYIMSFRVILMLIKITLTELPFLKAYPIPLKHFQEKHEVATTPYQHRINVAVTSDAKSTLHAFYSVFAGLIF